MLPALSFVPDAWLQWAIHSIVALGILLSVIGMIGKKIPFISEYGVIVKSIGILLVIVGVFFEGGYAVEKSWRDRVDAVQAKLDEAEKSPALKKAIASAWKQRAKKNRTAEMAAGHKYTGMGNPKSHDWADNAEQKYKEKRARVNKLKEDIAVDVSEDVAALINGEDLTEEFKTKAATIFEAAVVTRVKAEVAKIEEEFDTKLAEQVESIKEGLVEKVDGYLNYVVEQWMTDNELALENGMKTDIMESFVAGMKNLFMEHYIEVPAEKYDLVGELEEEVQTTKSKLDEQLASNVELSKQINEMKRVSSIGEFCADLADTDAEKFKGLAEELAFEDAESFKTKLQTIKENYFGKKATVDVKSPVSDEPVQLEEETKAVDPVMAQYLAALK